MKRTIGILLCCCLLFSVIFRGTFEAEASGDFSKSAVDFASGIKVGWNLGNTLDSHPNNVNQSYATPYQHETAWGNPQTTKEMIDMVAQTGFNAVRLPVTWYPEITYYNGKYIVNESFIRRVKEIVGWCYEHDMYVIVNMHHDDHEWLNISASANEWVKIKDEYQQIWQQIAEAFKDYDEKLILEGCNEVTATTKFDGCGDSDSSKCWWGHNEESFVRLNELYEIFVNTVRGTGGNNEQRYLMLPTYGAQWYARQVNNVWVPNYDKHIIIDIHWYNSSEQMNASKRNSTVSVWKSFSRANNVGIVVGECGFSASVADSTKAAWATSFVKSLKETYNIPVFLWDDGQSMRILERSSIPLDWNNNSHAYVSAVIAAVTPKEPDTEEPYDPEPVKGDVDGDYNVGPRDVLLFRLYLANDPDNRIKTMPETADCNDDNSYDMKDVLIIRKIVSGKL